MMKMKSAETVVDMKTPMGKSPVRKAPMGKAPVGKTPMGKAPGNRTIVLVAIALVFGVAVVAGCIYYLRCYRREVVPVPVCPTATITATPVGRPVAPNKFSTTTICWDTGDGSACQVWVAPPGGKPEKLFADNPPWGTLPAPWIYKGEYEFRMYAGRDHERVLARVTVKWTE